MRGMMGELGFMGTIGAIPGNHGEIVVRYWGEV